MRRDYERWRPHLCGVCCLQMAITGLTGRDPGNLWSLTQACRRAGVFVERPDGSIDGAYHLPLAEVARTHGVSATVAGDLTAGQVALRLAGGAYVMLSIDLASACPPLRGGHLILAHRLEGSKAVVHDPSSVVGFPGRDVHLSLAEVDRIGNRKGLVLHRPG
jgi:hypothetical protein